MQLLVDGLLCERGDRCHPAILRRRFAIVRKEPVLVQAHALRDRPLAQSDIVLLAASEVEERRTEGLRRHDAQVRLHAVVEAHGDLGLTRGKDLGHTRKGRGGKASGGIMVDTRMEGATVLGSLELTGKTLLVTVNSAQRAAQVEALISAAAGDLLRSPLTTIRTVDQMRADQRRDGPREEADEIPPEIAHQLMRDHLDKHYRETLDAPIPALGGKSPRQAVRTAAGQAKVIDWLKLLENRSAGRGGDPIAEYDFGWMWVELGLQEHRK